MDEIYNVLERFLSENDIIKEDESLLTASDMEEIKSNLNKKIKEVGTASKILEKYTKTY